MILSPYTNPPYKPPTRNPKISNHNQNHNQNQDSTSTPTPTTAPPKTPPTSPKRKHISMSRSGSPAFAHHLHLATEQQQSGPSSSGPGGAAGNESPRTKVAEQFRRLELEFLAQRESSGDEAGSPRKRARRGVVVETPLSERVQANADEDELPEDENDPESLPESNPTTSSPTPTPRHGTPPLSTNSIASNPASSSPGQDRTALTWQDSEITGHDIDAGDVNDDGEGINGIGFRPTPAMAWSRKQRRRQQVNEWRVREAREARMRRLERRRGGSGSGNGNGKGVVDGEDGERRAVRFAESFHVSGS